LRGTRLLTGNVAASAIPTDVEYARYLGKRRYSRESAGAARLAEPFLSSCSLSLRVLSKPGISLRRRGPVQSGGGALQRGAARCSRDFEACSSFPRLARACASISSLSSTPFPSSESSLSLCFSVDSILRHLSLFHSLVPASRPRPNPCARVMIRDCVKEVRGQNLPSCVALSLARSLYLFRSFSCSSLFHSLFLPRVEWNGRVCYRSHSHRCRSSWPLMCRFAPGPTMSDLYIQRWFYSRKELY